MTSIEFKEVLNSASLGAEFGLTDLLFAEIAGRRVLYAFSRADALLIEVEMAFDGTLSVVGNIDIAGDFGVGSSPSLALLADWSALTLAGLDPVPGQAVTLDANGALVQQASIDGVSALIAPENILLGDDPAIISGRSGGGLDIYVDSGNGYEWRSQSIDTASTYFGDIADIVAFQQSGMTIAVAVSPGEQGLTLLSIDDEAAITPLFTLGNSEGLAVSAPHSLAKIDVSGATFIAIGASGSSSLSMVQVNDDQTMRLTDHILDSTETRFQSVTDIAATSVGDFAYLAAGGADGGITLFTLLPGGSLIQLATIADDSSATLYRMSAVEMTFASDALQIFASSEWEPGLTRMSYDLSMLGSVLLADAFGGGLSGTAFNDQVVGSDVSESLDGGLGDDIVYDGAGEDALRGGSGADLFVFEHDHVRDVVLDFEVGVDKLDLSRFDFLYDASQIIVESTTDGAILTFGTETIEIFTADSSPLYSTDLTNEDILNIDRPPQLAIPRELFGGPAADALHGAEADDTIDGAAGNDTITGYGGADILGGGDGHDQIDAGAGDDSIDGGSGADTLVGGEGNDFIDGGSGGDIIYADDFDWTEIA